MTNKTQTLYKSYIIEEYFATKKTLLCFNF